MQFVQIERIGRTGYQEIEAAHSTTIPEFEGVLYVIHTHFSASFLRAESIRKPKQEVNCQSCGVCCHYYPIIIDRKDKHFLDNHREQVLSVNGRGWYIRRAPDTQTCVNLKGALNESVTCSIYETRPMDCRSFERESDRCLVLRQMYKIDEPLSGEELELWRKRAEQIADTKITGRCQACCEVVKVFAEDENWLAVPHARHAVQCEGSLLPAAPKRKNVGLSSE